MTDENGDEVRSAEKQVPPEKSMEDGGQASLCKVSGEEKAHHGKSEAGEQSGEVRDTLGRSENDDSSEVKSDDLSNMKERRNAFKRKGDYSFRSGNYTKAIERYSSALALDPNNYLLLSNRSAAHLALGHNEKALRDARDCVIANPIDCRGHSRVAVALQTMEQYESALESFERVLALDPENEVAKQGIALCKEELENQEFQKEQMRQEASVQSETDFQGFPEYDQKLAAKEKVPKLHYHFDNPDEVGSTDTGKRSYSGMSELSKQLRVLQGTIQSQEDQIDRLERQLRIMSEMKGVSVSELRLALKVACQEEAHSELHDQVAALRTQVSTMAHSSEHSRSSLEQEAASRARANLELRVGELEEIENTLRSEIRDLYRSLSEQTARAAQLSSTCEQQKEQLIALLKTVTLVKSGKQESQWSVVATDHLSEIPVDKGDSSTPSEADRLAEKLRNVELELRLERDRAKLLEIQVEAREMEGQLHRQQFKSRLQFQEDRIQDLEKQLSSKESTEENSEPLERSMLASQVDEPSSVLEVFEAEATPVSNSSASAAVPTVFDALASQTVASGFLLKKEKKKMKGWKKRYFVLYRSLGTYQLSYSDGPGEKAKGSIGSITTGVSTVAQTNEFPKHPFVFVLHVNSSDSEAPVLYAAAASQQELRKWLHALSIATNGHENEAAIIHPSGTTPSGSEHNETDPEMIARMRKLERLLTSYGRP